MLTNAVALLAISAATPKIQWYTNLQDGFDEAARTNMPVFLMSAAPQCAEVPGNW